jgi:hypothetical protein
MSMRQGSAHTRFCLPSDIGWQQHQRAVRPALIFIHTLFQSFDLLNVLVGTRLQYKEMTASDA